MNLTIKGKYKVMLNGKVMVEKQNTLTKKLRTLLFQRLYGGVDYVMLNTIQLGDDINVNPSEDDTAMGNYVDSITITAKAPPNDNENIMIWRGTYTPPESKNDTTIRELGAFTNSGVMLSHTKIKSFTIYSSNTYNFEYSLQISLDESRENVEISGGDNCESV